MVIKTRTKKTSAYVLEGKFAGKWYSRFESQEEHICRNAFNDRHNKSFRFINERDGRGEIEDWRVVKRVVIETVTEIFRTRFNGLTYEISE